MMGVEFGCSVESQDSLKVTPFGSIVVLGSEVALMVVAVYLSETDDVSV
jgi:hypothetical protein